MSKAATMSDLIGLTLSAVEGGKGDDEIWFTTTTGRAFRMYHGQDCCENVAVEDIAGDLADLVGMPIVQAEESSDDAKGDHESGTWTFYKLATAKGSVTIRWLGTSNGYYSESVDFEETAPPKATP